LVSVWKVLYSYYFIFSISGHSTIFIREDKLIEIDKTIFFSAKSGIFKLTYEAFFEDEAPTVLQIVRFFSLFKNKKPARRCFSKKTN
jgi:hypothetical protein